MNEVERNIEVIKGWYQKVWNERNSDYIDQHYAPDGKAYGLGDSYLAGPAAFKAFHEAMLRKFPDIRVELQQCFGCDDRVALHFSAKMTHQGRTVELVGGGITRLRDGKIVEAWNVIDFLALLEQMDIVPANSFQTLLES